MKFCEKYNPDYQREICGNTDACYFGDFPTLSTLKLEYGKNAPVVWVLTHLHNLSEYCGCKGKLEGKPLEECAFVISTEFHYLKVSELMLFFHRFKAGRYGRFYGAVDPLIITESLRKFVEERWQAYSRREQEGREKPTINYEAYLRRKESENNQTTTES